MGEPADPPVAVSVSDGAWRELGGGEGWLEARVSGVWTLEPVGGGFQVLLKNRLATWMVLRCMAAVLLGRPLNLSCVFDMLICFGFAWLVGD